MFWTPPSIPWLTLCLWFIWLGTVSWNFLVTSSECQRKRLLEDMLCTFQPLAKGDLVDHVLHTLIMYKDCLGIMKEQCKNSRLPHLLMIVVHGETLWSPAPQPMDDDGWWWLYRDQSTVALNNSSCVSNTDWLALGQRFLSSEIWWFLV